MAKGNYQAYQQLQPIQADFSGPAKRAEEIFLTTQQAKKKAKADADAAEGERQKSLSERLAADLAKLDPKATGLARLDQAVFNVVSEAADRLTQEYDKAKADRAYADSSEFIYRTNKLGSVVKTLVASEEGLSQKLTTYKDLKKDRKVSNWFNSYVDDLDVDNVALQLDDNYDITALSLNGAYDPENEELTGPPVVKSTAFEALRSGEDEDFFAPIDYRTELGKLSALLGDRETQEVLGFGETRRSQTWEDIKVGATNLVMSTLGTKENPTAFAKSLWSDVMNLPPPRDGFTKEYMDYMQEALLSDLRTSYGTKDIRDVDFSAQLAAERLAKEAPGDENTPLYTKIRIAKDPDTGDLQTGYQGEGPEGSDMGTYFTLPLKAKIIVAGKEVPVSRVFLSNDNKLKAVIEMETMRMSGSTVTVPTSNGDMITVHERLLEKSLLDEVNLSSLANVLELDNANTMRKFLVDYREAEKRGEGFPQQWGKTSPTPAANGVNWASY